MNEVINVLNQDGCLVVSSREVARNFDKEHKNVLAAINTHIQDLLYVDGLKVSHEMFIESEYENRGKKYPEYLLTRDGFSLLAMGFTGKKALEWKLKYIEVFNKMEKTLTTPRKLSAMEQLKLQYQVIDEHEERLSYLENNMTIDFGQQQRLQNKAKSKAVKVLGGINSPAYRDKSISSKVFSAIWKDYKNYFMLGSYRDTAKVDFHKALDYLDKWTLQGGLLREVEECNRQIDLEDAI